MKKLIGIILVLALVLSIGGYIMIAGAEGKEAPEKVAEYVEKNREKLTQEIEKVFENKGLQDTVCEIEQITETGADEKRVPKPEVAIYIALPLPVTKNFAGLDKIEAELKKAEDGLKTDFKFFGDKEKGCEDITKVSLYFCTSEVIDETTKEINPQAVEANIIGGVPIVVYEKEESGQDEKTGEDD